MAHPSSTIPISQAAEMPPLKSIKGINDLKSISKASYAEGMAPVALCCPAMKMHVRGGIVLHPLLTHSLRDELPPL